MIKKLALILYYGLARYLPASTTPLLGGVCKRIRVRICKCLFEQMGANVNIEQKAYFGIGNQIRIGDYSGIGVRCEVRQPVYIGSHVLMAPDVLILRANHTISRTDIPMMRQGSTPPSLLVIEDDVWLGARSIILPGCKRIGKGAVVSAGSIVTKDVPAYAIVGGNPARIIRMRGESTDTMKTSSTGTLTSIGVSGNFKKDRSDSVSGRDDPYTVTWSTNSEHTS